jgi:RNA recognition motif-containing protein
MENKVAEEKKSIDTGDVKAAEIEPTCTLYIRKLNDKVKIEEMRTCLYHMFSTYGEVIQIRMRQSQALRGQAFVVFRDIRTATTALD